MRPFLRTHGTCQQEGTTSGDVELRADVTGGVWMRVLDRFECRNSVVGFTTAVSQYVDKAVRSTHRLWARLQAAGQDQGNRPWDLEEGGGLGREPQPRPVETLDITSPLSYIPTHLSTCLTNPVTTPLFLSAESSTAKICVVSHHTSKICEPHHMIALRMQRKKAKAGTLLSITRDLNRPPCDLIHCSCAQCQTFRKDSDTWQPGSCQTVVGCKCPW